jgi:PIN domain nuclease of toxin-antitoxin system
MKTYVLDASALMTFFEDRPGAEKVEELLAKAAEAKRPLAMSVVNWGEVYYSVWRARGGESGRRQAARDRPASH